MEGRAVVCDERDRDRYGRIVGICHVDGVDLNAAMVAAGWAVAFRRYSSAYVREEESARAGGLGIWGSEFVVPWEWRDGVRLQ